MMKGILIATFAVLLPCMAQAMSAAEKWKCKDISEEEWRAACFERAAKTPPLPDDPSPAELARQANAQMSSRKDYADKLRKAFLSSGLSLQTRDYEKGEQFAFPDKYEHPRLVIMGHFMSDPLIFKLAGESKLLETALQLGFKTVHFVNISGDPYRWLYDLRGGLASCDVDHRVCL
jgi:hypothetical protein